MKNQTRKNGQLSSMKKKIAFTAVIFIAPVFIYTVIFRIIPIFFSLILSFTRYDGFNRPVFNGIQNYKALMFSGEFWNSVIRTMEFSVLVLPLNMLISLVMAVLINNRVRGIGFFRALYYLPVITPLVAASMIWMWLYDPQYGIFNFFLSLFSLPPVNFLSNTSTALASVAVMRIWRGVGWNMMIYLAGLQGISAYLYEAAKLDGAGTVKQFTKITWPLLRPVHLYVLIVGLISTLQSFTEMYVMTGGGPLQSTTTVGMLIYTSAFDYMDMGYACSMSFALGIIIMVLSVISFTWKKERTEVSE